MRIQGALLRRLFAEYDCCASELSKNGELCVIPRINFYFNPKKDVVQEIHAVFSKVNN